MKGLTGLLCVCASVCVVLNPCSAAMLSGGRAQSTYLPPGVERVYRDMPGHDLPQTESQSSQTHSTGCVLRWIPTQPYHRLQADGETGRQTGRQAESEASKRQTDEERVMRQANRTRKTGE